MISSKAPSSPSFVRRTSSASSAASCFEAAARFTASIEGHLAWIAVPGIGGIAIIVAGDYPQGGRREMGCNATPLGKLGASWTCAEHPMASGGVVGYSVAMTAVQTPLGHIAPCGRRGAASGDRKVGG